MELYEIVWIIAGPITGIGGLVALHIAAAELREAREFWQATTRLWKAIQTDLEKLPKQEADAGK